MINTPYCDLVMTGAYMSKRFKRKPGKPLERQELDYDIQTFRVDEYDSEVFRGKDFRRLETLLTDVGRLSTLVSLQKRLTIWNVNEFMVRENPTQESFEKILETQIAWSLRFMHVVKAKEERKEKYLELLERVKQASLKRFSELSSRKK